MVDGAENHCGNSDDGATIVSFSRDDTIFAQGDSGDDIYLLLTGQVLLRQRVNGRDCELDRLNPGDMFGEMGVLGDRNRIATAIAVEDSSVAVLSAATFRDRIEQSDRFVAALLQLFIRNINDAHRSFLRRPRSLHDHLLMISTCLTNLRRFAGRSHRRDMADTILGTLNRLDEIMADLTRLAPCLSDRRTDILIDPEELDGIAIDQVIRSDSRRRYESQS